MSQLTVNNAIDELARINEWLASLDGFFRLDEQSRYHLSFVVEELFVNIVHHAFEDDDQHLIQLLAETDASSLTITIVDDGMPFNPLQQARPAHNRSLDARDPGGEGIAISRSFVNDLTYIRDGTRNQISIHVITN